MYSYNKTQFQFGHFSFFFFFFIWINKKCKACRGAEAFTWQHPPPPPPSSASHSSAVPPLTVIWSAPFFSFFFLFFTKDRLCRLKDENAVSKRKKQFVCLFVFADIGELHSFRSRYIKRKAASFGYVCYRLHHNALPVWPSLVVGEKRFDRSRVLKKKKDWIFAVVFFFCSAGKHRSLSVLVRTVRASCWRCVPTRLSANQLRAIIYSPPPPPACGSRVNQQVLLPPPLSAVSFLMICK